MRISRAIADLLRERIVPTFLRAGKAAEHYAGVMREIGEGAKTAARTAGNADLMGAGQVLASKAAPVSGFNPVHGFGNSTRTRLSAIYGDRLRISGVGPAAEQHLRDLELLPDSFHNKLLGYFASHPEGGIDIIDGTVTDILTDLRGVTPRGWPPGSTWDDVPGLHDPSTHRVIIGVGPHGNVSLAVHETGHAFDDAIGNASESVEFRQLYDKMDITKPYYAQPGNAGRQETFAESLAVWALNRHMPPDYRANSFADKFGIRTNKQARGALLDSYFSNLQHRLEPHPL
ncbi:hypothetical protein D5S18_05855 [Nocardia panacis]|uniref:ATLF-like domain-containing protein n=1 Tax=Nocardia panacis TaxID=2340916 RepID=A0A3A4KTN9_9NOCA|nr:hypothetical protein [Nocardia panacis]RJO78415.1 hypothetical protein D5S18_05855 [Nocardia panacis]